jgi:GAF domain-containing protein
VLYVEHELLPDAFPASRIKILAMLSSQIAISIENSALYEQVRHSLSLWLAIAVFHCDFSQKEKAL